MSKRLRRTIAAAVISPVILIIVMAAWLIWGGVSNPAGRKTIGEITPPRGYERVTVAPESFGAFIKDFPLQGRGAHMRYYNGKLAYGQSFGYAVLDLPMLSNMEQCADAVMRMRAEYLWDKGRYDSIHFHSFSGVDQRYSGGSDRKAFENYLRRVFDNSNTSSLRRELKEKPFQDISPGDVLVYESPGTGHYGHAVLVADLAVNHRTGKKALMLAQSSTPALSMHIIRDILHPIRSPWVIIEDTDHDIFISGIRFQSSDLRTW